MNIEIKHKGEKYVVTDISMDLDQKQIVYNLLGNNEVIQIIAPQGHTAAWLFNQKQVIPELVVPTGDQLKSEP